MATATRGSRRTLRGFVRPSAVLTRIRSPSRSTQTVVTCGEPSDIIVASCPKFGSVKSLRTPGESVAVAGIWTSFWQRPFAFSLLPPAVACQPSRRNPASIPQPAVLLPATTSQRKLRAAFLPRLEACRHPLHRMTAAARNKTLRIHLREVASRGNPASYPLEPHRPEGGDARAVVG